jgi:hypothetical protein
MTVADQAKRFAPNGYPTGLDCTKARANGETHPHVNQHVGQMPCGAPPNNLRHRLNTAGLSFGPFRECGWEGIRSWRWTWERGQPASPNSSLQVAAMAYAVQRDPEGDGLRNSSPSRRRSLATRIQPHVAHGACQASVTEVILPGRERESRMAHACRQPASPDSTAAANAGVLVVQSNEVKSVGGQRNSALRNHPSPIARVFFFADDLAKVLPGGSDQIE